MSYKRLKVGDLVYVEGITMEYSDGFGENIKKEFVPIKEVKKVMKSNLPSWMGISVEDIGVVKRKHLREPTEKEILKYELERLGK